jgi:Flp pilus assembly protein TadD
MMFRDPTRKRVAATACLVIGLAGCATTSGPTSTKDAEPAAVPEAVPALIDVQDDVGFTITEEVRIGAATRADYERALSLLDQGASDEGIALLQQIVVDAPEVSAPRIDLGIALHERGDLEAAEAELAKALVLNPAHPIAHNELGIIYRKTGRFEAARNSYEAALEVYSGYHFARRNLAVLCDLYLGDLDCALENYEAYMQTVPGDDEATIWIADLKSRMALGE